MVGRNCTDLLPRPRLTLIVHRRLDGWSVGANIVSCPKYAFTATVFQYPAINSRYEITNHNADATIGHSQWPKLDSDSIFTQIRE